MTKTVSITMAVIIMLTAGVNTEMIVAAQPILLPILFIFDNLILFENFCRVLKTQ